MLCFIEVQYVWPILIFFLLTSITYFIADSEDSGIYSSLVRSDSLHERSWFYTTDGEDVSYVDRVILEIVESEFVYVHDLQQVITVSHRV